MFVLFWVLVLIVLLLCGHLGGAGAALLCVHVCARLCVLSFAIWGTSCPNFSQHH